MGDNSFYQATEGILYGYMSVCSYIEDLEEKLKEIENAGFQDIKAITYDKISVKTYAINKSTENAALAKIEYIEKITKDLNKNKASKNELDSILSTLKGKERQIIRLLYFKDLEIEKCMKIMKLKKSTFYSLKDRTVKKISIKLFGVDALKENVLKILGD